MALINTPPLGSVDSLQAGQLGPPREGWRNFFQSVFTICNALTTSGTTAQRPVSLLWIGRTYYDVSLNRPIWYTGTNWIRADGVVV